MGFIPARDAHQVKALGQSAVVREVVQRGQQFALGEVAGCAEDDERRRRDGQPLESGRERIVRLRELGWPAGRELHRHRPPRRPPPFTAVAGFDPAGLRAGFAPFSPGALLTAWPPNWLRSAASTRSA